MSGSTWPTLTAGAKAKASEVESKFDWIEGDFLPFTGGTKTDATYDLGSNSYRWVDCWLSGRAYVGAGAEATPAVARNDAQSQGMYFTANDIGFSIDGDAIWILNDNGTTISGELTNDGTANGDVFLLVNNTSNTAGYDAYLNLKIAGTSAGDPFVYYQIVSGSSWTTGADNSDSDAYKIDQGATVGSNTLVRISTSGIVTQPGQPSFLAYNSAADANATGDGTNVTVDFDTEVYDLGSDFSADTFTAPDGGKYLLTAVVSDNATTASWTSRRISIVTSNRNYDRSVLITNASSTDPNTLTVIADMDASDTATIVVDVTGGAKTVAINGGTGGWNSGMITFFSGSLIN